MSEIDAYIARFSPELQQRLLFMRQTAKNAFPDADEKLCHSLPAFATNGAVFMFYGAYKDHISICVGYDWIDFLKVQFPQFSYTMATIRFPHKDSFPEDVIQVICDLLKHGHRVGAEHNNK